MMARRMARYRGVRIGFEMQGLQGMEANLRRILRYAMELTGPALEEEAIRIMLKSFDEVPVDTGALQESGYVESPKQDDEEAKVTFGYGGEHSVINPKTGQHAREYAVTVHEDLAAFHAIGKARYLSDPIWYAAGGAGFFKGSSRQMTTAPSTGTVLTRGGAPLGPTMSARIGQRIRRAFQRSVASG